MKSRKNPWIAGALSVLLPGAGQFYNRQRRKALVWYAAIFLLPILFILCECLYSFWGLVLMLFLFGWLYLYNIGDAIHGALRPKKMGPRIWDKILVIALVIFIAADVAIIAGYRSANIIGLRAFRIISNSMAPTLQTGDSFVLDVDYYRKKKIECGNIISFYRETYKGPLCKRVIGLPGDRIKGEGNAVEVNGSVIQEAYAQFTGRNAKLDGFNQKHRTSKFGPVTVPEGQLFVLGDNRDNSFDSRDPEFGFVPIESVWAKPLYIYFSTDRSRIGKSIK